MLLKEFIKDCTNSSHNNGTYNDSKSWQIAWSFEERYYNTPWTRTKQMCHLRTLQAGPWNTGVISYSCTRFRENRKKKSHSICSPWIYWQYYSTLWACSSCTFQSTQAAGNSQKIPIIVKIPQQTYLRCNQYSRPSCLWIFSQKFWPPCNHFAQDSVSFCKKTKPACFF